MLTEIPLSGKSKSRTCTRTSWSKCSGCIPLPWKC
jgi:hypothetical protein